MPRLVSTDRRWLEKHGQKWRVTVAVPRDLKGILGTRLKRNLNTDSLAVANTLKLPIVSELQGRIEQVRQERLGKFKHVIREAAEIAKMTDRLHGGVLHEETHFAIRNKAEEMLGAPIDYQVVHDEDGELDSIPIYDPKRVALSKEYVSVATGQALPIATMHEGYLERGNVKARTRADDVRAIQYLVTWCEREQVPVMVKAITRKVAVRFADDLGKLSGGLAERTQNKYLGRLSRYWAYLYRRDLAQANPWVGLQLEVAQTKHDEEERAFTDDEVRRLLIGGAQQKLMDLMLIGALTGARLDAIVDLKVKDTSNGAFTFKPQKKEKTRRDVPIHPDLMEIVLRRSRDRMPDDDFFPDWPGPKKVGSMRERSFKASNAFTAYRRACGVDQVVEGKRRALVNFHSFRRWFCTKAERTGHSGDLIAAIVGHKRDGMTLGRYSEGPKWEAAKQCIEKISLPPLDATPIKEQRSLQPRNRRPDTPAASSVESGAPAV